MKRKTSRRPSSKLISLGKTVASVRFSSVVAFVAVFTGLGLLGAHYFFRAHALDVEWNVECNLSHFAPDDPIVYPGVPGASHMHSFYGNSSTNAATTTASLQAHDPTGACLDADLDNSAYWVPSIYKRNADGTATLYDNRTNGAQLFKAYYRRAGGVNGPVVHPFPVGLRMIAGDSKATTPQPLDIVYFDCGDEIHESAPRNCGSGPNDAMRLGVRFPSCWDGVHLDSADHKSHMAYANPTSGACPADHPVSLPALEFAVITKSLAWDSSYFLSSGGVYSAHGDFFNVWDARAQNALVSSCLNNPSDCDAIEYNAQNGTLGNEDISIKLSDFTADPTLPSPTSSPTAKIGDINGDGSVNVFDMSILLAHWAVNYAAADLNHDGTVNVFDLSALMSHWGT